MQQFGSTPPANQICGPVSLDLSNADCDQCDAKQESKQCTAYGKQHVVIGLRLKLVESGGSIEAEPQWTAEDPRITADGRITRHRAASDTDVCRAEANAKIAMPLHVVHHGIL